MINLSICFADHSPPSQFGGTLPRRNDSSSGCGGGVGNAGSGHNGFGFEADRRFGFGNNGANAFGSCHNIIENIVPTIKPRVLSPCKINNGNLSSVKFQQHHQQNQSQHQTSNVQQPPAARQFSMAPKAPSKDMDDLIHLPGPLTEDAVMRTLQARFAEGKHFVSISIYAFHIC